MSDLLRALVADFVDAARDPEVSVPDVALLAQEVDIAAGRDPADLARAARGVAPLLEADGPVLYISSVLLGGLVERGAPADAGAGLARRLPAWARAAGGPADAEATRKAWGDLSEVWRPLVAVLGADSELRASAQDLAPQLDALDHEGAAWIAHLLRAGAPRALTVWGPDRAWARRGTITGVADLLQLSWLLHGALDADVPEAVTTCVRGEGPPFLPEPAPQVYLLTDEDGAALPEGLEPAALPEPATVHVALRPEPVPRPVGRAFSTLRAELALDDVSGA